MKNKLILTVLGALALSLISIPRASAGTEVIQDYGGRDVAPRYNYAPPRPVYYPPPPIGVAVYPRFGYYHRPWRGYGWRGYGWRGYGRRAYWGRRHWH